MEIDFLGATREVGRSCFMVRTDSEIMLDCGLKIHNKKDPHLYPMPPPADVDAVVITHPHLDHVGYLPSLFDHHKPMVLSTPPTREMSELLLLDSAKIIIEEYGTLPYKRSSHRMAMESFKPQGYHVPMKVKDTTITFFDAGHIPGSAMALIEYQNKRILYTGDFKLSDTQMHNKAEIPGEVDVLITESTYANRDHPNRKDLEVQLVQRAREVIERGGNLLLPAFAVGRTQELVSIIKSHDPDMPVWVDGMGVEASQIVSNYPSYIRDAKKFRKAFEGCRLVQKGRRDRQNVLTEPSVIISTAGMLQGGPALGYLLSLNDRSEIVFTGYSVEGTNGYNLLQYGYVEVDGTQVRPSVPVHYLDFSAHAGRSDLFEFVDKVKPKKIFCIHGDSCQSFADELALEGYDAYAPAIGEKVQVETSSA
ncbi:MAG: MBL fold metallo-hydrolase [Candidatus Micrarchaeota archaeon]